MWTRFLRVYERHGSGGGRCLTGWVKVLHERTCALVHFPELEEDAFVQVEKVAFLQDVAGMSAVRVEVEVCDGVARSMFLAVEEERFVEDMLAGTLRHEADLVQLVTCAKGSVAVGEGRREWREREVPGEGWRLPLFPHQEASLAFMLHVEGLVLSETPVPTRRQVAVGRTGWYVDADAEALTERATHATSRVRGGVLADGAGTGKTVVSLCLCHRAAEGGGGGEGGTRGRDATGGGVGGTLVLVPINLPGQWREEVQKAWPEADCLFLLSAKDMRGVTRTRLCQADLVVTTFYFLRGPKYAEMVDAALAEVGMEGRGRAVFAAWRRRQREAPVLESVPWRRLLVDEVHEVLNSAKDARLLRTLDAWVVWGLSATPGLAPAEELCSFLLAGGEAVHPNTLHTLVAALCHGTPSALGARADLRLVQMTAPERLTLCQGDEEAELVERLTQMQPLSLAESAQRVLALRRIEIAVLAYRRRRLLRQVAGTPSLEARLAVLLEKERVRRRSLAPIQHGRRNMRECSICMEERCDVLTPCGHLFCRPCVERSLRGSASCPLCRGDLQKGDLLGVGTGGLGSKMLALSSLVASFGEPVVVFVQWKRMLRNVRAALHRFGLRVLTLEGNTQQRALSLADFAGGGGVLLMSMDESYAGIRIVTARRVVFSHAIVGDRERVRMMEEQAIARVLREGQTREVTVHSVVVADCAEERLWRRTHAGEGEGERGVGETESN